MRKWSLLQQAYLLILALLGGGSLFALLLAQHTWSLSMLPLLGSLVVAYGLAEYYKIPVVLNLPNNNIVTFAVAEAAFIFAVLVAGPAGVLSILIASLVVTRYLRPGRRANWLDVFFNLTHLAIDYCVFLAFSQALIVDQLTPLYTGNTALFLLGLIVLYPLWEFATFSLLIAMGSRRPVIQIARTEFTPIVWVGIIPAAMGALAAVVYTINPWLIIPAVVPLILAYYAFRAVAEWLETNAQLRAANTALQEAKDTLEGRVAERTDELARANDELAEANGQLRELHAQEQQARRLVRYFQHELRNYATELEALVPLIRQLLPPDHADAPFGPEMVLSVLSSSVTNLNELMQHLLLLSRDGTLASQQEQPLELAPLLEQARLAALTTAAQEQCALTITVDAPPDLIVAADPIYLTLAVRTALRNALDAAQRQPYVPMHVQLQAMRTADQVVLRIADDGPGFPAEALARTRLADGTLLPGWSGKSGGHGLGLSLIDRVATLHGGTMTFGNHADQPGARVEITLPAGTPAALVAVDREQDVGGAIEG